MDKKRREYYVANIAIGNIVAFKDEETMFSGKIVQLPETSSDKFVIKMKNGSIYYVEADDIVWVKNGSHWPNGIFNALKYSKGAK